jgi:hypothetical protein
MDPEEQSQGHPAWQEVLNELPEDLRPLIRPKLEEWDKRTQGLVQGVHSQYDPYKKFVENNIDPQVLEQSLYMANALQKDPEAFVKRVIENYGIEAFNAQQQEEEEDEDVSDWDGEDISKHPQFLALAQQLEQINSTLTEQQQKEQQTQAEREHEAYMESLKAKYEDKGEFDELYVSALMANGLEGDKAVEMYYDTISKAVAAATGQQQTQQDQQQPPVVMGGSGNAGSGLPDQKVSMGSLSNGDVQDLVIEMLKKQQESNQ